jgi:ditrans,polycis-polyprenyl diphosphate synthase
LNVCFPYTSRDEITTAIRETVIDYSKPTNESQRSSSDNRLGVSPLQQLNGDASPPNLRSTSSSTDDLEASASSSTTLNQDSPNGHPSPAAHDYPDPETITTKTLDEHMYTAGSPPLDLLVRTSGVERLSDFMLWQCHENTEVVFLECLWPEFDLWHFLPVMVEWQWRRKKHDEKAQVTAGLGQGQKVKVR